eukprot:CAMPEP_0114317318 /NCGR_PEP_ID=MMETSP0059-20121206/23808_1 /TAXON_ID=36894 /ORGANISM="Pyramimonas parkeae, Strain CCMP726" /LENGTH=304 /DNA_ID=CAMNT_0001443579 /DNA_START=176 /DNA_END=1092 /DNA_ORIENTATION=+
MKPETENGDSVSIVLRIFAPFVDLHLLASQIPQVFLSPEEKEMHECDLAMQARYKACTALGGTTTALPGNERRRYQLTRGVSEGAQDVVLNVRELCDARSHSPAGRVWRCAAVLSSWLARNGREVLAGRSVLELGAGAGAPGLTGGQLFAARTVLTDAHPSALHNLAHNLELNLHTISRHGAGGEVSVAELDWNKPSGSWDGWQADVLLASEVMYSEEAVGGLVRVLKSCMKPHGVTYFVQDTTRNGFASFVERLRVEELEMDVQPWTQEDMRSLSTDKIQYTPEVDDAMPSSQFVTQGIKLSM